MIEQSEIFDEVKDNLGLWCGTDCAGADLAAVAGVAITNKLKSVCVAPASIGPLWTWLENARVKIIGRFYVDKKIDDEFMSGFSSDISSAFRMGADGAIVFLQMRDMEKLVNELVFVRDDLFFNKTLSVGLDICEIETNDWDKVFKLLHTVRADSLTLYMSHDDGDKSDFVGRIYAMLNTNMGDWHGALHFVFGKNIIRIDQVYRLTQQIQFNLSQTMLFWVDKE